MIPPLIHYCWFGPDPTPHAELREGWRSLHPDVEIIRWDERNAPDHPFLATVLADACYSKAADFMRLWLMINRGGIYLDVDVECVRSLTPLRSRPFFCGVQRERGFDPLEAVNSAVLGARRGHWFAVDLMRRLLDGDDGTRAPMDSGPRLISTALVEMGYEHADEETSLAPPGRDAVHVLPRRAFYPYSWEESRDTAAIGPDTFAVHLWDGSWVETWRASRKARGRS